MEPTIELRVAELLASRLYHDLISPVGAVNSGIELIVRRHINCTGLLNRQHDRESTRRAAVFAARTRRPEHLYP